MNKASVLGVGLSGRMRTLIEDIILKSRYLLVPLYCALLFGILTITFDFIKVLAGSTQASSLTEQTLQALELLDITMIANLIWLISAGSYYVFIDDNYPGTSGKKRPRCLAHISSGILKEKMAGSLIGVSSVHLLAIFLNMTTSVEVVSWQKIGIMLAIHVVFIIGLLAFNRANAADHHIHNEEKEKPNAEANH